jgi:hypothetical protein
VLTTNKLGRYFLNELNFNDSVLLEPQPLRSYATPELLQKVVITSVLTHADTTRYEMDGISMIMLVLEDVEGTELARWEREEIEDVTYYQLPCHQGSLAGIKLSSRIPSGVTGNYTVATVSIAEGVQNTIIKEVRWRGHITLQVTVDSLYKRLISITLKNNVSGQEKKYSVVLSKNLEFANVVNSHMEGRVHVVNNKNSLGLTFSACSWWYKRSDDTLFQLVEDKQLYYSPGPADGYVPGDSLFVRLTLTNGAMIETCSGAESVDNSGDGNSSSDEGKKITSIAVYPNPVPLGGTIKIKQDNLFDGEDEDSRFVKYSLFDSQGHLILHGDASPLYEGQGLAMPQTPGIYHLLLESKTGKKWVVKIAVE